MDPQPVPLRSEWEVASLQRLVTGLALLLDSRSIEHEDPAVSSGEPRTAGEVRASPPRPFDIGATFMNQKIAVRVTFDAHHQTSAPIRCERNHGHNWTMTATALGRIDGPKSNETLENDLFIVISQWRDKSLNEIAQTGDPWHVAAWVMEQLSLGHPNVVRVELDDGRMNAIVERELR